MEFEPGDCKNEMRSFANVCGPQGSGQGLSDIQINESMSTILEQ